jgi:hypothetical protein
MAMKVVTSFGSFVVAEGDRPESPHESVKIDSADPLRLDTGGIYHEPLYSYYQHTFNFISVRKACGNNFKTLFGTSVDFTIEDDDMGTLSLMLVPGSFSISYGVFNDVSFSFRAESKEAE